MREVVLKLDGLEVSKFDPRALKANIKVFYIKDNARQSFEITHALATKSEVITNEIIKELKKKGSIETENSDDVLQSIYVKKFLNEDKSEERLLLFFSKLYERGRLISRERNHTKYMNILDEIQHYKMTI